MSDAEIRSPVLIVGGGAIGLSLAWELARRGQKIALIESESSMHPVASWAGAGILPPSATRCVVDPLDQLRSLSYKLHSQWADTLRQDTGIDTGYRRCGAVYLASSAGELATLAANQYWWDEHGIEYRRMDRDELVRLEPHLGVFASERMRGAWLLPDECQIRNPRFLKALRAACHRLGVEFYRATIEKVVVGDSGFASVRAGCGSVFESHRIALCGGAWTRLLLEPLGITSGIMPVRGQIVLYRPVRSLLSRIINEGNRYLVPRDDGLILAGSVEEEAGYVCETTEEALEGIGHWARSVVPELGVAAIEKTWAGLRPGSYDGLPYLGSVPGTTNLFVAAGHFRNGLYLSCGTAVVLANLMMGQANDIDLSPFRVGRG